MMDLKNKKILYINQHTIQRIEERSKIDILFVLDKYNKTGIKKFKILQSKDSIHYVKEALFINNKYILPVIVFDKDGIEHYKVLSLLYENQFFSSINLNFGMHTEFESIQFDEIRQEDVYFDEKYLRKYDVNQDWFFREVEYFDGKVDKEFDISSKGKSNYILENKKLPLYLETFNKKVYKLV